jgi:hypothetical protein
MIEYRQLAASLLSSWIGLVARQGRHVNLEPTRRAFQSLRLREHTVNKLRSLFRGIERKEQQQVHSSRPSQEVAGKARTSTLSGAVWSVAAGPVITPRRRRAQCASCRPLYARPGATDTYYILEAGVARQRQGFQRSSVPSPDPTAGLLFEALPTMSSEYFVRLSNDSHGCHR